eukprot:PhM_4_TR10328/c3_g1_i1/m.20049
MSSSSPTHPPLHQHQEQEQEQDAEPSSPSPPSPKLRKFSTAPGTPVSLVPRASWLQQPRKRSTETEREKNANNEAVVGHQYDYEEEDDTNNNNEVILQRLEGARRRLTLAYPLSVAVRDAIDGVRAMLASAPMALFFDDVVPKHEASQDADIIGLMSMFRAVYYLTKQKDKMIAKLEGDLVEARGKYELLAAKTNHMNIAERASTSARADKERRDIFETHRKLLRELSAGLRLYEDSHLSVEDKRRAIMNISANTQALREGMTEPSRKNWDQRKLHLLNAARERWHKTMNGLHVMVDVETQRLGGVGNGEQALGLLPATYTMNYTRLPTGSFLPSLDSQKHAMISQATRPHPPPPTSPKRTQKQIIHNSNNNNNNSVVVAIRSIDLEPTYNTRHQPPKGVCHHSAQATWFSAVTGLTPRPPPPLASSQTTIPPTGGGGSPCDSSPPVDTSNPNNNNN